MKHLKTYNESVKDHLKPKTKDEIIDSIKGLPDKEKFILACKYHLTWLVKEMVDSGFDPSFNDNMCLLNCGVLEYDDIVDILIKNDKVIQTLYKSQLEHYPHWEYTDDDGEMVRTVDWEDEDDELDPPWQEEFHGWNN